MTYFAAWANIVGAALQMFWRTHPLDAHDLACAAFLNIAALWFAVARLERNRNDAMGVKRAAK